MGGVKGTGPAPGGVLFRAFFHSSGALVVLFTHFSTGPAATVPVQLVGALSLVFMHFFIALALQAYFSRIFPQVRRSRFLRTGPPKPIVGAWGAR